ncbi:MAG: sulfotransferase family 2 domain-containing protein [Candidatus Promineifilaceae bacterium]
MIRSKLRLLSSHLGIGNRPKPALHFLHLGKTGGSAIRSTLKPYRSHGCYQLHLHPHTTALNDIPIGGKVFFFVRDPISRFVSGFYSGKRQGQPLYNNRWSVHERVAFANFETPNNLACALSDENQNKRKLAEHTMQKIRHVRDSYWRWFRDPDYFASRSADILFIGSQAQLNSDFEVLKSLIGLPHDLSLPTDEVQSHKTPAHLDRYLSERAIVNLTKWYSADFHFVTLCEKWRIQSARNL